MAPSRIGQDGRNSLNPLASSGWATVRHSLRACLRREPLTPPSPRKRGAREQTADAGTSRLRSKQIMFACNTKFDLQLQTQVRAPPRDAPGDLKNFPPVEGVGNAGCPLHPQPPVQQESTGVEAAGPPESPGIPARNGFNGFLRALLGDEFLFATVIGGLRFV
jgi:hypothetical protein